MKTHILESICVFYRPTKNELMSVLNSFDKALGVDSYPNDTEDDARTIPVLAYVEEGAKAYFSFKEDGKYELIKIIPSGDAEKLDSYLTQPF